MTPSHIPYVLDEIEIYLEHERLLGWDPYDALCSPVFALPGVRSSRVVRFGAQQVLKRSPWNLRPLLGIKKQLNPVSVGLYVQGQALRALSDPVSIDRRRVNVDRAIECLTEIRSRGYSGSCWGYPFDWEARYASIPANTPTVVATGMITNALWIAHGVFGQEAARELIVDAADFVLRDLNRTPGPHGSFCWSYSPLDQQAVLNATAKGSRLLAQAHALGGPRDYLTAAARSVAFVTAEQSHLGSWPYAATDARRWADNFHTGYVLECLQAYRDHSGDHTVDEPLRSGWDYYRANFFTSDLTPKYYDTDAYPLDATACAQAIITLCRFGDRCSAVQACQRTLERLYLGDGSFAYRRGPRLRTRIPFLRWSTAWMYCALSALTASVPAAPVPALTRPRFSVNHE